ncbi:hypothetical protein, partial [Treponema endosymbiont of Eucomonympha sp.]|uniref:hypothetical protein n=1 Tax=Treponema endosymbiont of Eucomonympha sp. TaxID=1580831 RepID=UPI001EE7220D
IQSTLPSVFIKKACQRAAGAARACGKLHARVGEPTVPAERVLRAGGAGLRAKKERGGLPCSFADT